MAKIKTAIFPVGGLGTRFLPATKAMPKEMLPIIDKPLIHYAYEEAVAAGIEQFIFITGRNKNAINNHFDNSYELQKRLSDRDKIQELQQVKNFLPDAGNIIFIRQQNPLGLGHAIWCARNVIGNNAFAVLLADDIFLSKTPCLKQMIDNYNGGHLIATRKVKASEISNYGVLDIEWSKGNLHKAKGLVEKPTSENAPSNLCISGRYILESSIFNYLDKQKKGAGGEIQLTDAIANSGSDIYGFDFEGSIFDCGSKIGLVKATIAYAMQNNNMQDEILEFMRGYI